MQRARGVRGHGIAAAAIAFAFHPLPGQTPDADHVGTQRVADVERPDHALAPALGIVGQEGELACIVDAEAMRARAGRVVETDFLRCLGPADVEDVEAGTGIAALIAGQALRVDVQNVVADRAQLVTVHAGRRLELPHLARVARVAHVVHRKTFRRKAARRAHRSDVGVPLVHLDQAAAAPGGGRIMADEAKVPGFLGKTAGHDNTPRDDTNDIQCGWCRPPITGWLWPRPGSSHTPAPPGFLSAAILASMRDGLPLATAARTASARSAGRSTLTPSMPAARAMAAKLGL